MSLDLHSTPVSRARATANRLRWWWQQRMGWPGLAAVILLLAAAVLSWGVRPAIAARESQLLREQVMRLDATVRVTSAASAAAAATQRDPRDLLRDSLPPVARRGETVAAVLALLEQAKVQADRAEYSVEDEAPGLVRMRVAVPVKGSYAATRDTVAKVLNALPHAALDSLMLERGATAGDELTGQLHFSLFFRKEAP